ncbi:hypothetical protein CesoFtcFv8_004506 [Champsocephalus esox]|uniref:Uncharacterized protein n=1 Tax=Champsocephalus esox TaxID=159716 RepID=A0AAN8CMU1_9TELE|nr:hypothetical protein CesoFtcFv8_004506 [Champsocephalus esox]
MKSSNASARSLSWARTAADLASLSGAVSTRQHSKRRAWGGGRGKRRRGGGSPRMNCNQKWASAAEERSPVLALCIR